MTLFCVLLICDIFCFLSSCILVHWPFKSFYILISCVILSCLHFQLLLVCIFCLYKCNQLHIPSNYLSVVKTCKLNNIADWQGGTYYWLNCLVATDYCMCLPLFMNVYAINLLGQPFGFLNGLIMFSFVVV